MTTAFDFAPKLPSGAAQSLGDYRGRVLLIVNTASKCGFTPQYEGLEALWRKHRDAGLVVLGFPCNQFGGQEPGTDAQIASFCSTSYDVTFPLMAKVEVNGGGADPLFRWLKQEKPGLLGIGAIKWNFTKFLVGRHGSVVGRYPPNASPASLERDIVQALSAPG
jgi:glutathione peroxidase